MTPPLLTALFWIAAAAVVLGQAMILRSTARAWRHAGTAVPVSERIFAWGPAFALLAVLWFSYQAAIRPPVMQQERPAAAQGVPL